MSRSSDVSDDSNAAASTPSGGYWPMMRRTVTGRPLAASSLSADAQGGEKAPVGRRLQRGDVDGPPGARHQVVDGQHQGIGVAEADLAPGAAPAVAGQMGAQVPPPAVGVAAAGRQHDVTFAILAVERIERQIVGATAPARRALHQPVRRQAVAAASDRR